MSIRVRGTSNQHDETRVLTIGHSTRTIEEFIRILHAHGVECIADVRSIPRSHHNPQFNRDSLPRVLKATGIDYEHIKGLGGLRRPAADSLNMGWENTSFRGYADYMQTEEFEKNLNELIGRAKAQQIAIMCAESVPWRCHRSLIADALLVNGIPSEHIISMNSRRVHKLTSFAQVRGRHIIYPKDRDSLNEGRM